MMSYSLFDTDTFSMCCEARSWCLRVEIKGEKKKKMKLMKNCPKIALCTVLLQVRIRLVKAGLVLRCGCGAETGLCQPGRSGSSPAAYPRGKPPPPGALQRHGSPLPAAVDWPPAELLWTPHSAKNRLVRPHLWLFWQ